VDVITIFDVIEHPPQPRDTLALCRFLKPGGIIVLTTGDFAALMVRWGRREVAADDAAAASLVFHPGKRAPDGGAARALDRALRLPRQDRALSLILLPLKRMLGLRGSQLPAASRIGYRSNLFDAMRVVERKGTS
jgi:hypothetical protein